MGENVQSSWELYTFVSLPEGFPLKPLSAPAVKLLAIEQRVTIVGPHKFTHCYTSKQGSFHTITSTQTTMMKRSIFLNVVMFDITLISALGA